MEPQHFLPVLLLLFLILYQRRTENQTVIKRMIQAKKAGRRSDMQELAARFVGKECLIYTFNSQLTGRIREICGNAILLEDKNTVEAINLDFIVRIREYPTTRKGKKKSLVLD